MSKRIFKIEKESYPYTGLFVENHTDPLSGFFIDKNPFSVLFGLKGFESQFISAIDDVRRIIYIKSAERKIIDLFLTELFENKDFSGYKIDLPESARDYLELIKNPKNTFEIYTVMEYSSPVVAGTQKPKGEVVINRDSRGFPAEVKIITGGTTKACSTVFWLSDSAAELSLECFTESEMEKWAIYVLSSLASELFSLGIKPLYLVHEMNVSFWNLAEKVGFRDSGQKIIELDAGAIQVKMNNQK